MHVQPNNGYFYVDLVSILAKFKEDNENCSILWFGMSLCISLNPLKMDKINTLDPYCTLCIHSKPKARSLYGTVVSRQ